MVSKSILDEFYHIPLQTIGFFHYHNSDYYFSKQRDLTLYQHYIHITHFPPYYIQNNIFDQPVSQHYILYKYMNNAINIEDLIKYSLQIVQYKTVHDVKKYWIEIINNCQQEKKNQFVYHFNFALAELAIELLNYYYKNDKKIPFGIEHKIAYPNIQYICNPDNLILNIRINDLQYLFSHDFITSMQLMDIIRNYQLTADDIILFLCMTIFPQEFFYHLLNHQIDIQEENKKLKNNLSHLQQIINIFNQYIKIPDIYWIKNNVKI